ncbi:hypothetical protein [Pedobacter deserti]|uniref:hypothetical protein n=1 Tax=Pedobacter deserti TaxID=2817382 RepID=UPI002108BF1E|nr:hypothetical protein [Pedobacter sp. SYSU D00382]
MLSFGGFATAGMIEAVLGDGEIQRFSYSFTKKGELLINPKGGRFACYDGYGCITRYKRIE